MSDGIRKELNELGFELTSEQKKQEWRKNNTHLYSLRLNRKTDADIIEWMQEKQSASACIKALIRNAIEFERMEWAEELATADSTEDVSAVIPAENFEEYLTLDATDLTNTELSERLDTGTLFDILRGQQEANKRFKWYLSKGLLPQNATGYDTWVKDLPEEEG